MLIHKENKWKYNEHMSLFSDMVKKILYYQYKFITYSLHITLRLKLFCILSTVWPKFLLLETSAVPLVGVTAEAAQPQPRLTSSYLC